MEERESPLPTDPEDDVRDPEETWDPEDDTQPTAPPASDDDAVLEDPENAAAAPPEGAIAKPAAIARADWIPVEPDFEGLEPVLALDGLRVERGSRDDPFVLEIERMHIPAGSFTAMLGGSGIGKTTLLTVLGLLRGPGEEPDLRLRCERFALSSGGDGGDDLVVFENLTESGADAQLSARERERLRREWIGFCLQGGELVPSLTLSDNCAVPAELCSLPDAHRRAHGHLTSLGMVDSAIGNQTGKLPGELSGGQLQRGVVARALTHDPRVILLDEPTAALDRGTAEEAIGLLRKLARERGQTVIMVTHDRDLAEEYADFIIEFDLVKKKHGRIGMCRARAPLSEFAGSSPTKSAARPSSKRTLLGYHLRLGLMDALGPLYHAFRIRKREHVAPPTSGASRLRFVLQLFQNSAVVVAIALLVLFLRGMRSGLIEDFRTALRKSPTAREIRLFGDFQAEDLTAIASADPRIQHVVPVASPKVGLTKVDAARPPSDDDPLATVTIHGLVRGDPTNTLLDSSGVLDSMGPDHIVLSGNAAAALGVAEGDRVRAWAQRLVDQRGDQSQRASTEMRVLRVLAGADRPVGAAWVHFSFTRVIGQYQAGVAVKTEHIDWPGVKQRMEPRYRAFLLFKRSKEEGLAAIPSGDLEKLRVRSFKVEPLDPERRAALLGPILKTADEMAALRAEEAGAGKSPRDPLRIFLCTSQRGYDLKPSELDVEQILRSSILVPWNEALDVTRPDGSALKLVGCSFRRMNNWALPYLRDMPYVFKWTDDAWNLVVRAAGATDGPVALLVPGVQGPVPIVLDALAMAAPEGEPAVGIVSAQLLARLRALAAGEAEVESERRVIFRPAAREEFGQLRVYPDDVFAVPGIVSALEERGYTAQARTEELREIQGYTRVLGYIVRVISILAGIIALLTVALVFHDVARNKKRVLATLRIMGLTRGGAFTLLMVRGVLVALIAGGLLLLVGAAGSAALNGFAGRHLCLLGTSDYLSVLAGVLAVCVIGTYLPARAVSRTEPIVALQQAEQEG